jgi:hypothetical protein
MGAVLTSAAARCARLMRCAIQLQGDLVAGAPDGDPGAINQIATRAVAVRAGARGARGARGWDQSSSEGSGRNAISDSATSGVSTT